MSGCHHADDPTRDLVPDKYKYPSMKKRFTTRFHFALAPLVATKDKTLEARKHRGENKEEDGLVCA